MSSRIVVLCGPTGVGKTELSLLLASHFCGDIINADASQMKKGLNIGTAKLSISEKEKVPHHLFDVIEANDHFSIKDYQNLVRPLFDKITRPFLVGGSGLYIKAALTNYELTSPARGQKDYNHLSDLELFTKLEELNPLLAKKTHPHNRRRVLRYIEISKDGYELKEPIFLYECLILLFSRPRAILYDRINRRVEEMLRNGWIDEVKNLVNQGINIKLINEIGYQDIFSLLQGEISYEECLTLIKQRTRNYAKRQLTWFRNQFPHYEIDLETTNITEIINIISQFYNK